MTDSSSATPSTHLLFNFIVMSGKREKELTHRHHKPVDCYHLELPTNLENQWYPGKKTWMKFECIWSQEFGNCWRWTSTKALVTLTTISVKAWCSQQIKIFPFPSYPFTTSATQSGSSRSQDMSTVILRSVASGCTVSRGRARFPPWKSLVQASSFSGKMHLKPTLLGRLRHDISNIERACIPKYIPETLGAF